jgi:biopolymer transport protein ExbD
MAGALCVLLVLVMSAVQPLPPRGLMIHLLKPGVEAYGMPGTEPLMVLVESAAPRARAHLYLNSQPISWDDFGASLARELRHRPPHSPVYVEGDGDMEWQPVMEAIDAIRGWHGEVILLTTSRPRRR